MVVHKNNTVSKLMNRVITFVVVLLFATTAFARNPKLSSDLEAVDAKASVNVIVRYKVQPSAAQSETAKKHGAKLRFKKQFRQNIAAYKIKRSQLENLLADDPNIAMITPDRPMKAMNDYTAETVGANIAQSLGYDGQGVGVAILDSGIIDHPDLKNYKKDQKNGVVSRIVYTESFVEGADGSDKDGHGSHVAGIVGGNGNSSTCNTCTNPVMGVAPGVNIINLQVLDATGNGADSQTIAAIERAIELKDQYNIRVMNLSLGRPVYESYKSDPLCQAVEDAWKAGIVVVVSAGNLGRDTGAGNNGYGTITAPGNDPYVITVGAMKADGTSDRSDDSIASYSSKGPALIDHVVKPDIVAPGNKVESLYVPNSTLALAAPDAVVPVTEYNALGTGKPAYFRMSGTSMAAPVVAGAAALLIQKNPNLTPDQVKAQLMKTATRDFPQESSVTDPTTGTTYTSNYDIFTVGAGYLDVASALGSDVTDPAAVGTAQSPVAKHDDVTGAMSLTQVPGSVWDATTTATVWGPQGVSAEGIVWGTINVSQQASSILWSEGIVWGTAGVGAEGIVWGTLGSEGIVWGTLGSEGIVWGTFAGE